MVREGLLHTREPKAREAIISAHLPFVNSHNELCFIFMLHKNFQKRQISEKPKTLPSLKKKKNLFHISKAFISAFTILYALLCLVLKSYKTKISFFYNSWHVMFLALEFSLDKESDYTVQFYWSRESLFFYET